MKSKKQILILLALFTCMAFIQTGCKGSEEVIDETVDTDGDGIPDQEELRIGTDPENPDTDGDGLSDGDELYEYNTDPLVADTDGDGLSDGDEVMVYNTDPLNPDTDGDGLSDGDEVLRHNTDPLEVDSDNDGLNDYEELFDHSTNPNNPDTDGDGFTDGDEIDMGTDPLDPNDPMVITDLNTVNFDFDRSNINDQAARMLSENVELLLDAPSDYRVSVEAYTDHIGGDQYNLRLSQRRANSVVEFYKANGISEDRIDSRGLGKAPTPCAQEDSDGPGCRENRRAESKPIHPYRNMPNRN
ncbi:MAG: OmpA family protein [Balneolales bacterium]